MTMAHSVQTYFQAFERKDRAAWLALCAPDAVIGGPALEPPVAGHPALSALFDHIAAVFASIRFERVAVHVAGLHAAAVFNRCRRRERQGGARRGCRRVCIGFRRTLHAYCWVLGPFARICCSNDMNRIARAGRKAGTP
ncbi:MAG: nuclear transport factor 2 family protein [Pseudomonadota bacterium]